MSVSRLKILVHPAGVNSNHVLNLWVHIRCEKKLFEFLSMFLIIMIDHQKYEKTSIHGINSHSNSHSLNCNGYLSTKHLFLISHYFKKGSWRSLLIFNIEGSTKRNILTHLFKNPYYEFIVIKWYFLRTSTILRTNDLLYFCKSGTFM